jgi:hypothetical protein
MALVLLGFLQVLVLQLAMDLVLLYYLEHRLLHQHLQVMALVLLGFLPALVLRLAMDPVLLCHLEHLDLLLNFEILDYQYFQDHLLYFLSSLQFHQ